VTASWQFVTLPRVPEYFRATPTDALPCVGKPVSFSTNAPSPRVASELIFYLATGCQKASSENRRGIVLLNIEKKCINALQIAYA
jgi:hypothetical protein